MTDVTPQTADTIGTISSVKRLILSEFIYESFADNITAFAGGGQTNATPITTEIARVTTVATAGDSILLPPALPGLTLMLIQHGAKPMQVFGVGTDTIDDQASGVGVSQMVNSVVIFVCTIAGKWYANGLGTGFSGSFETMSYTDALTARAGGGQGLATPITTMMSRFTTVATAGDSAILPTGVPGMNIVVINASATSMNVFPDTGSAINALAANAAFALAAGKTATFVTTVAGTWHSIPLVP
jgi:hypothetical protein